MRQFHKNTTRLYSDFSIVGEPRTWAEVDTAAIVHNYRTVVEHVSTLADGREVPVICVVKADAYGHGMGSVARTLIDEGCRFFAVSCIEEGEALRRVCRSMGVEADILILGYTRPALASILAENDLITTLVSAEYAQELARYAKDAGVTVRVHVKLDTGMNRIGFPVHTDGEIQKAIADIARSTKTEGLLVEGLFTHFARADEDNTPVPNGLTETQISRFFAVRDGLCAMGIRLFCHICNSAAAIRFPACILDGVRVGISLYGCEPSDLLRNLDIKPAMRLVTLVSHIHTLKPGETVSYGGTFSATDERRIATLPVGYADGFQRSYSGASVRIATRSGEVSAPIVGRICMDQCMVDVTGTDVSVGDTVTLFGAHPEDIRDLARRAGTIAYEVLCLVSARVPRRYI